MQEAYRRWLTVVDEYDVFTVLIDQSYIQSSDAPFVCHCDDL